MLFRYLRIRQQPLYVVAEPGALSREWLAKDAEIPITLHQINALPENARQRVYRNLIPASLLTRYNIDPIHWKSADGEYHVWLKAEPDNGTVLISAKKTLDDPEDYFCLEIADNPLNGIDLNLLILNNPESPYFRTSYDDEGQPTLFGTLRRILAEEQRAMQAGLAPGQVRESLNASSMVLQQLDAFLATLGHRAYFLEPLTYASAWVFERRGFAYVRGHKLMDTIHKEFQPGGALFRALDGSSPFRQPGQWETVRGRAWAIHDGILEAIDAHWDKLRMVKQVGRHASVETCPGAKF
jgi:hypothetical protein